jgi:hypothetical protein
MSHAGSTARQPDRAGGVTSHAAPDGQGGVRVVAVIIMVVGVIFAVVGAGAYVAAQQTLADQKITVSSDASHFAGKPVKGPFTAYEQAMTIGKHAKDIAGGKTYAELPQNDPNRNTVMTASFLQASLFTSVVAFGVAAMAVVLGIVLILLGWALRRMVPRST